MDYKLKSMLSDQSRNSKTRSNFLANSTLRMHMKMADLALREAELTEINKKAGLLFKILKSDKNTAFNSFKLSGDVARNAVYSFTLSYSSYAIWKRLTDEQLSTVDTGVLLLSYIIVLSLGSWINISAANYLCNIYLEHRRVKTQKLPSIWLISLAVLSSSLLVNLIAYFSSKEIYLSLRSK